MKLSFIAEALGCPVGALLGRIETTDASLQAPWVGVPFSERAPDPGEVERLRLAMRSHGGWRQIERVLADVLGGTAAADDEIFDVFLPSSSRGLDYGLALRSRTLSRGRTVGDLARGGRLCVRLPNPGALFQTALTAAGVSHAATKTSAMAQRVGTAYLSAVRGLFEASRDRHPALYGRALDLSRSVYLVLTHALAPDGLLESQWHSLRLNLPEDKHVAWYYSSDGCIRCEDPVTTGEVLLKVDLGSGGRSEYYPQAKDCLFSSSVFALE